MLRFRLCLVAILGLVTLLVAPASAQLQSLASLNGAYYVRYLGVNTDPADSPVSFSGTITFDGAGKFTVAGAGASRAAASRNLAFATSGTYVVQSSGMFSMTNPFDVDQTVGTRLYGGIGTGAVIASSTDWLYCDLFVAIPVSTAASLNTLNGNYRVASLEFLDGDFALTRGTNFSMTANGSGSLGNVTISGSAINLQNTATTQTSTGATYTLAANGTGTLVFPAPSGTTAANTLLSGSKVLYVSQDGNFFIAGGATAYDIVIGTKAATGGNTTVSNKLYFTANLENYARGTTDDGIYASNGTTKFAGSPNFEFAHQRPNVDGFFSYDLTFVDALDFGNDGTVLAYNHNYVVGGGGNFLLETGTSGDYFLQVYVKALDIPNTGAVFLHPHGIVNASNNIPFTAQVSPGEVVTLFGNGLAAQTAQAGAPFPKTLAGVSVTINGTTVPVYSVSPTQVSIVVPFNVPLYELLTFQVNNNGVTSNEAKVWSGANSPGIFTVPPSGIGNGAILHADFTLVSATNPARAGETVLMFVTGMGTVNSTIEAGAVAPGAEPFARLTSAPDVYVNDVVCRTTFAGLAPGLGGLYQLNVVLPTPLAAGTYPIAFGTDDAVSVQGTVTVGN